MLDSENKDSALLNSSPYIEILFFLEVRINTWRRNETFQPNNKQTKKIKTTCWTGKSHFYIVCSKYVICKLQFKYSIFQCILYRKWCKTLQLNTKTSFLTNSRIDIVDSFESGPFLCSLTHLYLDFISMSYSVRHVYSKYIQSFITTLKSIDNKHKQNK